jgi:Tfp pilus assembly protein PilX
MNSHNKIYTQFQFKKQKGVVLFIALIALVVMSLAAVALIRSVDTSTIIAGNLASKQSATTSADGGVETALNADAATLGYYATQAADPTTISWDATDSLPATGTGTVAGKDVSGNTVRYVVQRMCRNAGEPAEGNCLFGAPAVGTSSTAVVDAPKAGAATSTEQSPIYRITARVVGVKNTISFVQAFVY